MKRFIGTWNTGGEDSEKVFRLGDNVKTVEHAQTVLNEMYPKHFNINVISEYK